VGRWGLVSDYALSMPKILRPRQESPTPLFRAMPLILVAAIAGYDATLPDDKGWLWALATLSVGLVAAPLVLRIRSVAGIVLATVVLVVVSQFVGFGVWGSFVDWG
jgi:hypothetical protein